MNNDTMKYAMAAMAGLAGCGELNAEHSGETPNAVTVKETVVTNTDGTVTRTKRSERDIKDEAGNVIGRETSVYTETVAAAALAPHGKDEVKDPENKTAGPEPEAKSEAVKPATDSFLGLKFGETPSGADKAEPVPGERALRMMKFTPARPLKGFDEYYAFVSPKTRKLVKVCACAKTRSPPIHSVGGITLWRRLKAGTECRRVSPAGSDRSMSSTSVPGAVSRCVLRMRPTTTRPSSPRGTTMRRGLRLPNCVNCATRLSARR